MGIKFKLGNYPNSPLKAMGIDPVLGLQGSVVVPKLACSFCGKPVSETEAIRGIGKPTKVKTTEFKYEDGEPVGMDEKIIHVAEKLVACPGCSLNIKPVFQMHVGTGVPDCHHQFDLNGKTKCSKCGRERYIANQNCKTYSEG